MPIVIFGPVANFGHHPLGNVGRFKNFFTEIRKDPDACNYYAPNQAKVDILYSNCSHITFELNWVFILNFGSFFLLLRLQNIFSF